MPKEGQIMRKLAIAAAVMGILATSSAANADYYRNRGGHWVAPLVGGLIVGGMVGALAAEPRYYAAPPAYRTECRIVPVYDRYGYYLGDRRECYQVPNY
jgi:hypothetical protein